MIATNAYVALSVPCHVCKVDTDTFSEAEKALGFFSTLLLLVF